MKNEKIKLFLLFPLIIKKKYLFLPLKSKAFRV